MTSRSIAPAGGDGRQTPHRDHSPGRFGHAVQSSAEAFQAYTKHLAVRESAFIKKMDQLNAKFLSDIPVHHDVDMKEHFDLYTKLLREHTEKFARKAREHTEYYRSHHPANPNPASKN
jgi:hypothetical protein